MFFFGPFFLTLLLTACAGDGDSRYRDTTALERPPTLPIEKHAIPAEEAASPETTESSETSEPADQEEEDKPLKKGLGDRVLISERQPPELRIKQTFDIAWNTLYQALTQSGIKIIDRDRNQSRYYVSYDADSYSAEHGSLLEKSFGLFSNDYDEQPYLLTLSDEGSETKITATLFNDAEKRKRTDRDDAPADAIEDSDVNNPKDGAEKLLRSLYATLHDDLRENP